MSAPASPLGYRRGMTRKQRRLVLIGVAGLVLAVAAALVLTALSEKIAFFRSPTEVMAEPPPAGRVFRLGGLVEAGTVRRTGDQRVAFTVTDGNAKVPVDFTGLLPDLFREGQGVVAEGVMKDGTFVARTVLAKHDENYMPREVADALKKQGHWQPGQPAEGSKP